ncbi:MAG: hypothetical protein V2I67_03165 [Thermoanaerobaculales bacterium]|jgi:hypothetical protein|nr:hypothetical protein [Thermoanaerobaculales bacterium]
MSAYVIFSSKEPMLVVARQSIQSSSVLDQLGRLGIRKFIACEIPISHLRTAYGRQFEVIQQAIDTRSEFRVLDFNGRRIFQNLPFSMLGPTYRREFQPLVEKVNRKPTTAFVQPMEHPPSFTVFGRWHCTKGPHNADEQTSLGRDPGSGRRQTCPATDPRSVGATRAKAICVDRRP